MVKFDSTIMYKTKHGKLVSFSRDDLFISIYESCKFRQSPILDSEALTGTIIDKLMSSDMNEVIDYKDIVECVVSTLTNFDHTAANVYRGLHSEI